MFKMLKKFFIIGILILVGFYGCKKEEEINDEELIKELILKKYSGLLVDAEVLSPKKIDTFSTGGSKGDTVWIVWRRFVDRDSISREIVLEDIVNDTAYVHIHVDVKGTFFCAHLKDTVLWSKTKHFEDTGCRNLRFYLKDEDATEAEDRWGLSEISFGSGITVNTVHNYKIDSVNFAGFVVKKVSSTFPFEDIPTFRPDTTCEIKIYVDKPESVEVFLHYPVEQGNECFHIRKRVLYNASEGAFVGQFSTVRNREYSRVVVDVLPKSAIYDSTGEYKAIIWVLNYKIKTD